MENQSEREVLECGFGCVAFEVLMRYSQWEHAQMGG